MPFVIKYIEEGKFITDCYNDCEYHYKLHRYITSNILKAKLYRTKQGAKQAIANFSLYQGIHKSDFEVVELKYDMASIGAEIL